MIKTFKGLIEDRTQIKLRLSTNNGLTGYRIKKLVLFPQLIGSGTAGSEYESLLNVYTLEQDEPISGISTNYNNPTLVASATYFSEVSGSPAYVIGSNTDLVIDNKIVNQDLYLVHENFHADNAAINYYVELEQVRLDLNEATVATLKDMRGRE